MFVYPKSYDVIVVGAGHAGSEAALAAARMGCQTLLLSINLDTIGQMSCNPAVGGLAKGHLVREIDALGGEMGKATDMTGLQFRMLNYKKGPSVWAPRAQCDKKAYQFRLKWICEREPGLDVKQGQVARLLHKNSQAYGIQTTLGVQYVGRAVVITTGTFLRGLMHIGSNQQSGGRAGESAAMNLSDSLNEIGLELGRLKTGTPPRLLRRSIEDKIVKFAEKERHQIFLEPEGIATDEIYVNGFSTCLPFEVQVELVRTIVGCENAEIMRPAYAVEYDFAFPTQLHVSLETKCCSNLFLAGQINGTSGYEEAGAQGLIAGINAARRIQGKELVVLRRDQAYIGVLIDDLVTKGTTEPYRMFTSRAEYRLMLRQDNADLRLSEIGHEIGLLPSRNYQKFLAKQQAIKKELERLEKTQNGSVSLAQMLRSNLRYDDLPVKNENLSDEVIQQVEISLKYAGYIDRQETEVQRFRGMEEEKIPGWVDYNSIPSLRTEARQKLNTIRPETLGQP